MSDIASDARAREYALNHHKSFIVQAPAGSGKTELLTQRVLKLLAHVKKPEEIIALTFTRKAAGEMRLRIVEALQSASEDLASLSEHKIVTNNLALRVLENDRVYNWQLLQNPSRLNITTIDSLCAKIVKQTPVLSHMGGDASIIDDPKVYYKQAIVELFKLINTDDVDHDCNWTKSLYLLLHHFGCNYYKLQDFLLSMLYKREQWLPYLINNKSADMHKLMQYCWQQLASDIIAIADDLLPLAIKSELNDLLLYASTNLAKNNLDDYNDAQSVIINYNKSELHYWQAISYLLLTSSGQFSLRKQLDKRLGFPSKSEFSSKQDKEASVQYKNKIIEILSELNNYYSQHQHEFLNFINNFSLIRKIPVFDYNEDNWQLLVVLSNVLTILEAELRVIFKQNKITDFSGMAQAAIYALGTEDNPSDLSLYFDYNIKHVLVDEFQDTSYTQYQLLNKLVFNWDTDSSKTLFLAKLVLA